MADHSIPASYHGGDPERPGASAPEGVLTVSDTGVVDYHARWLEGVNFKSKQQLLITPDQLLGVSLDSDPRFDALAALARQNSAGSIFPARLRVGCQRDEGSPFTCVFGTFAADGRRFIAALQSVRDSCGEPPLPTLEDLAPLPGAPEFTEIAATLMRIEHAILAQNALLGRFLASLPENPPAPG